MSKRSIEETFQAIKPKGRKGIPTPPTIGVGVTSDNNELASSLSQAGQQISQLQAAYTQQAALISANTQALQGNTSAQGKSAGGVVGGITSSLFGGALGLLSPLISGIASLFGGSSSPAALPFYTPPPAVAISANLNSATPALASSGSTASNSPTTTSTGTAASAQPAAVQQVTVNVNAMDSQSFMDHSADIASAVREAMLNMHPINDVVAGL